MNIFETVKSAIPVRQAAEYYGLQICKNNMTCCPFHPDKHPSMKLNDDYYYCFGCGATGDVIDLTARLFDLGKYEAAKKLASDFGIDPDNPPAAAVLAKPKHRIIRAFREDEQYCFRVICDYLHLLESWQKLYAPHTPDEPLDDRFVEACQMKDYIEYLADILTVGDLELRVMTTKELLKDGKITELEKRLNRISDLSEEGEAA